MPLFFSLIFIMASSVFASSNTNEFIVYNETSKQFEKVNNFDSTFQMENTWRNLKKHVENNFNEIERDNFPLRNCFLEDFKYIKTKKTNLKNITFQMIKQWSKKLQTPVYKIEVDKNFSSENISYDIKQKLLIEANRARTYAYAPYSKFHVGAALITKSGDVYSGCNFENAAYGNTICAERSAIAKAVSSENRGISFQDKMDIVAVAVVLRGGIGSPCGNCRQALYEFNPNMLVIMADIDGENMVEKKLFEILPYGFGPISFENAKVE